MFKSNLYPELRSARRAKLQDKMTQIFIATAAGYILGLLSILYFVATAN